MQDDLADVAIFREDRLGVGGAFDGQYFFYNGLHCSIDEHRPEALFIGGDNGGFFSVGATAQHRADKTQSFDHHLLKVDLGVGAGQQSDYDQAAA